MIFLLFFVFMSFIFPGLDTIVQISSVDNYRLRTMQYIQKQISYVYVVL